MKPRKMSLRSQYFISFFSVAFIACAVFGIVLFFSSVRALEIAYQRQTEQQLLTLTRNISEQIGAMEIMSYTIQANRVFNWSNLSENRYNDITLLREFDRFRTGFHITDNYFLFYSGERRVYRVYRSEYMTNEFCFFVESAGIAADSDELYAKLDAIRQPAVIPVQINGMQAMIIAYPVFTMGRGRDIGRATLGFILSGEPLYTYARTLIGDFNGHIYFEFKGATMTIPATSTIPDRATSSNTLTVTAFGNVLTMSMELPANLGGIVAFETVNTIYIIVAALLVFVAAAFMSYNNYRPIRRLLRKYSMRHLDNMEGFLDSILSEKETIELKRQEQYEIIKMQTIQLLLSGDARYHSLMSKPLMEIEFSSAMYLVIAIKSNRELTDDELEALTTLIEQCSDEKVAYHLAQSPVSQCYAVIVSLPDETRGANSLGHVKSALDSKFELRLGASGVFANITSLSEAFNEALEQCEDKPLPPQLSIEEPVIETTPSETSSSDKEVSQKRFMIVKYVYENCADQNLSLDKLSDLFSLSNRYISNLIREATGLSYMEFLTGVRIKKATELLLGGNLSITETCHAVGYANLPHFTKTFKRVTGHTPSDYVSKHKKESIS